MDHLAVLRGKAGCRAIVDDQIGFVVGFATFIRPQHEVEITVAVEVGNVDRAEVWLAEDRAAGGIEARRSRAPDAAFRSAPVNVGAGIRGAADRIFTHVAPIDENQIDIAVAVQIGQAGFESPEIGDLYHGLGRESVGRTPVETRGNGTIQRVVQAVGENREGPSLRSELGDRHALGALGRHEPARGG